jgi:hypothetical protein
VGVRECHLNMCYIRDVGGYIYSQTLPKPKKTFKEIAANVGGGNKV